MLVKLVNKIQDLSQLVINWLSKPQKLSCIIRLEMKQDSDSYIFNFQFFDRSWRGRKVICSQYFRLSIFIHHRPAFTVSRSSHHFLPINYYEILKLTLTSGHSCYSFSSQKYCKPLVNMLQSS